MAIFLIIVFVFCVLLLLPIRVKGAFGDGKWSVSVYYVFIRVFHKGSAEEKPEEESDGGGPEEPSDSGDIPAEEAAAESPEPEPAEPAHDRPENTPESEAQDEPDTKPEPVSDEEDAPEPEQSDAAAAAESLEDEADGSTDENTEKPKERGFFRRLKPQSVPEAIGLGKDALASLSPAMRFLTRHFHFRHVKLYLAVGSDDPANTATLYGKICAGAYPLLGALQCWFDIEADEFRILADFYNDSITFRGSLELRVSPAALLLTVLTLGIRFLWRSWFRFRREDREEKLKERETAPQTDIAAA